jgi:hypothetical protein
MAASLLYVADIGQRFAECEDVAVEEVVELVVDEQCIEVNGGLAMWYVVRP